MRFAESSQESWRTSSCPRWRRVSARGGWRWTAMILFARSSVSQKPTFRSDALCRVVPGELAHLFVSALAEGVGEGRMAMDGDDLICQVVGVPEVDLPI